MSVTPVSAPDAASSPAHPDHDRWVKERTLKMEIEHAQRVGLPLRVAEAENLRLLERSERIARERKPVIGKPRKTRAQRKEIRGVTVKHATPKIAAIKLSPCNWCGTCRLCKRERRVFQITQKAKAGDLKYAAILMRLYFYARQAQDGTGPFVNVNPRDANRMVIRQIEEVCDATVLTMGPWL